MKDATKVTLLVMILALGIAGGVGAAKLLDRRAAAGREMSRSAAELQDTFAAVAAGAMKSVVHITTSSGRPADLFGSSEGIGSGVIVSEEGHILTNNHVIDGTREVRVRFEDGREFEGRLVGADPESDLALLKIDPNGEKLPAAALGDSDAMRVGDWVLAIGSPFGYNHTVTAGIVSAKHRRAQLNLPYQDFIQTDAAINPGNSGGALVNLRGEVVGINTAIVTESRRGEGVGLAIASNLAKWVTERLRKDGRVRRGYMGFVPHDIDRELVALLRDQGIGSMEELLGELGLKEPVGVFVLEVQRDTPADRAGLRPNDVIVEMDGRRLRGQGDAFLRIAGIEPGTTVTLKVLRAKQEREIKVELAERPPRDLYGRPRRK
ncbi:MAG: trypsin-like peptidase domain-containing protein [Planctomycetes bacterium]|nr:trypsin-like peptidase domain-containing protein [Planctomycetota bacterium]